MFNGGSITKSLIEDLERNRLQSELNKIISNYILTDETPIVSLYDKLRSDGYDYEYHPKRKIDKLAQTYKFVRWFHKPRVFPYKKALEKNSIIVYFDDYHVDVYVGESYVTFGKKSKTEEIYYYIKKKEREIKLKRLLK